MLWRRPVAAPAAPPRRGGVARGPRRAPFLLRTLLLAAFGWVTLLALSSLLPLAFPRVARSPSRSLLSSLGLGKLRSRPPVPLVPGGTLMTSPLGPVGPSPLRSRPPPLLGSPRRPLWPPRSSRSSWPSRGSSPAPAGVGAPSPVGARGRPSFSPSRTWESSSMLAQLPSPCSPAGLRTRGTSSVSYTHLTLPTILRV